jgi:hypothetical protein
MVIQSFLVTITGSPKKMYMNTQQIKEKYLKKLYHYMPHQWHLLNGNDRVHHLDGITCPSFHTAGEQWKQQRNEIHVPYENVYIYFWNNLYISATKVR